MKEKELTPGTVFPVLGTLLFFLPERYREKLCCVTPLAQKVTAYLHSLFLCFPLLSTITWLFNIIHVDQSKETNAQPYQMAKKDGNGALYCKEDTVTEDKKTESDRQAEEEDLEARVVLPSCQLADHSVHETALWSFFLLFITHTHTHFDPQLLSFPVPWRGEQQKTDPNCDVHQ